MIPYEIFILIAFFMIVFQVFGFVYGGQKYEAVVCLFLSAVVSFVLALTCYTGIQFVSGVWTNATIALLLTLNGIIGMLFFAGRAFNVVISALGNDTFEEKMDELIYR